MGESVLFWVGAVLLGGAGGVLIVSGLFGHRWIVSRKRRCPRCRTGVSESAELATTCPRCGFVGRNETDWYRGMRRPVLVGAGVIVLVVAVGFGSHPTARETGYLAFLPVSVRVSVWPEWRMAWRGLGNDTRRDWASLMDEVRRLPERRDSVSLARAAYLECLRVLRQPGLEEWAYKDAAELMNALDLERLRVSDLAFVTDEDVRYLMSYPNGDAAEAGVLLAGRLSERSPGFVEELFDWKSPHYSLRIDTVSMADWADRKQGRKLFDRILGNAEPERLGPALECVVPKIWSNDAEYEYVRHWLMNGPAETRLGIANRIETVFMRNLPDAIGPLHHPAAAKYEAIVGVMLDQMEEAKDDPAALGRMRFLSRYAGPAIPMYIQRLETTDSEGVAELLIWVFQAQGQAARDAIPSIERVQQNPFLSESLRRKAAEAVLRMQNPNMGQCRSG